jgi:SAM-dependent methyltransferase
MKYSDVRRGSIKSKGDFFGLPGAEVQRYVWVSPFVRGLRVLDAGCGDGYGTHYVAEQSAECVLGIDNDPVAIKFAQNRYRRHNLAFLLMDATRTGLSESFDSVLSFEVIEHLTDPKGYLGEILRILRPGGSFFISTPNRRYTEQYYESGKSPNPHHLREYLPVQLQVLLSCFFEVERTCVEFRDLDLCPKKKDFDNYVKSCAIPCTIRKAFPSCVKNAWLKIKGLPAVQESWRDFKIVQVDSIYELDQRFPVQLFHCRKSGMAEPCKHPGDSARRD